MQQAFLTGTFDTPLSRRERFTEHVQLHLSTTDELRILDLGCGAGGQLLDLATMLPKATLVGIDTSAPNIALAKERAGSMNLSTRADFHVGDYMAYDGGPFDVILSDSVLQNIDVTDADLFSKIARDLVPGGLLMITMPYSCAYNHALWMGRRVARCFRHQYLESLALGFAKRLHPEWDIAMLRERLPYLFMVPFRFDSVRRRRLLNKTYGLSALQWNKLEHTSPAQPKHALSVYRKGC